MNDTDIIKYFNNLKLIRWKTINVEIQNYLINKYLYIECNYHWTHGRHPYNENNINDINKVNELRSKNTKFYNNAIYTWTIRDVNKRNIAKQNNLNYIEFWNINEVKEWLNKN